MLKLTQTLPAGMNAAVRATVRVGLYTGAKVYFVHEVNGCLLSIHTCCIYKKSMHIKQKVLKASITCSSAFITSSM